MYLKIINTERRLSCEAVNKRVEIECWLFASPSKLSPNGIGKRLHRPPVSVIILPMLIDLGGSCGDVRRCLVSGVFLALGYRKTVEKGG